MSEQRRKRILIALFVAAVIWGLYNQPWNRRQTTEVDSGDATRATVTEASPSAITSVAATTAQGVSRLEWRIDPFRAVPGEETADALVPEETNHTFVPVLQGTMAFQGAMRCVLDGRVLQIGDSIGRWRVEHVGPGTVTLIDHDGGRVTLRADKARGI
jgi:hypothetical protein